MACRFPQLAMMADCWGDDRKAQLPKLSDAVEAVLREAPPLPRALSWVLLRQLWAGAAQDGQELLSRATSRQQNSNAGV